MAKRSIGQQPTLGIPDHVREYFRTAFAGANHYVSNLYSSAPTTHEEWLDNCLITRLREWSTSVRLDGDWIVRLDTHFLGGRRHWHNWEVADIGVLVIMREAGVTTKVKVAILQSKRLYAIEIPELDELTEEDYMIGMSRLLPQDVVLNAIAGQRAFSLSDASRYHALLVNDNQWKSIQQYGERIFPVHYLLYHPTDIPWRIQLPLPNGPAYRDVTVGAQVLRATDLHSVLAGQPDGYSPSYADLLPATRWQIENFIADEVLTCREGTITRPGSDELNQLFYRRSGPISAAIALTIDVPSLG